MISSTRQNVPVVVAAATTTGTLFGVAAQAAAYSHSIPAQIATQFLLFGWSWAIVGLIAAIAARPRTMSFLASWLTMQAAVIGFYLYRAWFEPFYLSLPVEHRRSPWHRAAQLLLHEGALWSAAALIWALMCTALAALYRAHPWAKFMIIISGLTATLWHVYETDRAAAMAAHTTPSIPAATAFEHFTRMLIMAASIVGMVLVCVWGLRRLVPRWTPGGLDR